jgi:hypothetical protein
MWDQNENSGFYFNDAASNPETAGEGLSFRHSGLPNWWTINANLRDLPGVGVVGTFDGAGQLVTFRRAHDLANQQIPAPNSLLNGPGYEK